jgi:hypothetical protein
LVGSIAIDDIDSFFKPRNVQELSPVMIGVETIWSLQPKFNIIIMTSMIVETHIRIKYFLINQLLINVSNI